MKKIVVSFLVFIGIILIISISAKAQTSPVAPNSVEAGALTVEQIIERAADASGGKAAWSAITAMHIKGIVESPATKVPGIFELYSKAPNRKYLSFALGNAMALKVGFDGTAGWKIDPGQASVDIYGEELEDFKFEYDFSNAVDLKQLFPHMALGESTTIEGRPAYTIIASSLQGESRSLFFDKVTGLEIGWSRETLEDGKALLLKVRYSDFRNVQGVQIPYAIQESSQKLTTSIHVQEVQVNAIVLNSIFLKPTVKVESAGPALAAPAFSEPHFGSGSVSGNTYTDSTFSFKYTFPSGWTVRSKEAEEQVMKMVGQIESGVSPAKRAAYDAKMERTTRLLNVTQYVGGSAGRFNSTIEVKAEKMDWAPGIQSGKDYLLNMEAGLKRVPLPMEFGPGIPEVMIAGKPFYRLDVDMPIPIARIHLAYFSTRIGNQILSFVFTTVSKGDLDILCKTLDSLQFDAVQR